MARSNIGRLLNERAEKELNQMGLELLGGFAHDLQTYNVFVGKAEGIRWCLRQIDEIEGDKE